MSIINARVLFSSDNAFEIFMNCRISYSPILRHLTKYIKKQLPCQPVFYNSNIPKKNDTSFIMRIIVMKKTLYLLLVLLLPLLLLVGSCATYPKEGSSASYPFVKKSRPGNIILCIGDGIGLGQIWHGVHKNDR